MDLREMFFVVVIVAVVGVVLLRGFLGEPAVGMSRFEWQRKIFARTLAVIALAIGVAITLSRHR